MKTGHSRSQRFGPSEGNVAFRTRERSNPSGLPSELVDASAALARVHHDDWCGTGNVAIDLAGRVARDRAVESG